MRTPPHLISDSSLPTLWIVVPCYNESSESNRCLERTSPLFLAKLESLIANNAISPNSKICFVDDGSSDQTWDTIQQLAAQSKNIVGVRLSRNCGHQNALMAGLEEATKYCDVAISMDCDGQDDINAIDEMLQAYKEGYEVVYGVRSSRESDTYFKRATAEGFYRIMNAMGIETVFNHADFRLLSKNALEGLAEFKKTNLFLRGLIPLVGFPSTTVEYERAKRADGDSHYPLRKMIALATNGITSLSTRPIQIISLVGIFVSLLSLLGIVWVLVTAINGKAISGWASTLCAIGLLGGIQLFSLGVIGEYIGKIYLETKGRPRFIVSQRAGNLYQD